MKIEELFWDEFINIGFLGAMCLVFLYALSTYVYQRKLIYLYYALYIFVLGLYLFSRSHLVAEYITKDLEQLFPRVNTLVGQTFQYIAHFAALQFGTLFLNAKKDYPIFYKAAFYIRWFFLTAILLSIINICYQNNQEFNFWLVNIERLIATLAALYFQVVILLQRKNKLVVFYIVGSIFFLVGAVVSVFAYDVIFMRFGTLLEILIFSLGLAYRSQLIQKERNLFKERMVKETKEKENILAQFNEDLKKQVLERSEALIKEQQLVEKEQKKVLKLSLEKEIDKVRMTALRAQMKPHFLFNALNAIRAFLIKEDTHKAYDYLTDFSRLVRYILESSEQNYVTLEEELKMLDIYVAIERMRAEEAFDYQVSIEDHINIHDISLPPLIIQPFLENAIVHGFDIKKPGLILKLSIMQDKSMLKLVITDNGKGRFNSADISGKDSVIKKKSMAIDLTEKRLKLLDSENSSLNIVDLYNVNNQSIGTQVELILPLINYGKKTEGHIG